MVKSKRAREAEAATAAEDFLPISNSPEPVDKKRKRGDDDAADQVKQKKAKKDKKKKYQKESRKDKKDERKNLQDLPEEDSTEAEPTNGADAAVNEDVHEVKEKKKSKDAKKEKKSQKKSEKTAEIGETDPNAAQAATTDKKKKKKKQADKDEAPAPAEEEDPNNTAESEKNARHIVFVGNLPFTATSDTIKAHFASLNPISVRCLKNKDDPNPCRGIAFVEFANVWTMRTCLDKFHHTMFEDGVSAARKINVELTAGGGGKTKHRRDKIREKNKKLDENRSKRIEKEKIAKVEGASNKTNDHGNGGIHPARLAMMNPGRARY